MNVLAELSGEVIALVVQPEKGRVVACTHRTDATVMTLAKDGQAIVDEPATTFLRTVLKDLCPENDALEVRAEFIGSLLYLTVTGYTLGDEGSGAATLALDLDAQTVRQLWRGAEGAYFGMSYPASPVGVGDRFVLTHAYEEETSRVLAFTSGAEEGRILLRLGPEVDGVPVGTPDPEADDTEDESEDEGEGACLPGISQLLVGPDRSHLFLVTYDPDNWDGNRIRSLALDADCQAAGPLETLVCVKWTPYSPMIGGACVNPYSGEVACLMYASEWETFVPVSQLPQEGDLLPVADLYLAHPDSEVPWRRVDVCGKLGVNMAFYDREADAPNLPHNFRVSWDFDNAGHEVTTLIALDPNTYLIGLFGGTLLTLRTDTGDHTTVHQFDPGTSITALKAGLTLGTALVGLTNGHVCVVTIPSTGGEPLPLPAEM